MHARPPVLAGSTHQQNVRVGRHGHPRMHLLLAQQHGRLRSQSPAFSNL